MTDYQLGQSIGRTIAQQAKTSADPESLPRRLLAQLQDQVGADTSLLAPLRDLITRPMFRQMLSPGSQAGLLAARESLLQSMADTYSPSVMTRLDAVLRGCVGMPEATSTSPFTGSASTPSGFSATTTSPGTSPGWASGYSPQSQTAPPQPHPQVITIPQPASAGGQGATAAVIALLSLLAGGLLVGVLWLLMMVQRTPSPTAQPNQPAPENPAPPESAPPRQEPKKEPERSTPDDQLWGSAADYKYGQLPGGDYPNSCAFSKTSANGEIIVDKSSMEFWACRDVGGDPETGYTVVWGDGKRTVYTFQQGGSGTIVGTNGKNYPITWSNSDHNGQNIIVISHQDGASSWIPGYVN